MKHVKRLAVYNVKGRITIPFTAEIGSSAVGDDLRDQIIRQVRNDSYPIIRCLPATEYEITIDKVVPEGAMAPRP